MRRWIKGSRRMLLAALVALGLLSYAVLLRDVPGPPPSDEHGPADAMVVLGGMGPERVEMTTQLYAQGVAPVVVVNGDHGEIVAALTGRLPAAAIRHEMPPPALMKTRVLPSPSYARWVPEKW